MLALAIEIITIGLPFCAFKMITGLSTGSFLLIAFGAVDTIINLINLGLLFFTKRRSMDACILSFIVRLVKKPEKNLKHQWQDLGNALDVLLSFSLVAYMIGGGHLPDLPPQQLTIWNVSVILNVFGAGYSRLHGSIENLRSSPRKV